MKTYLPAYRRLPRSIAKEYRDGATVEEISIKYKVHAAAVRTALLSMGVKMRPPGTRLDGKYPRRTKLSDKQIEEILYTDQNHPEIPHTQIGEFHGVSRERIRQICKAAGHATRREKYFPKYIIKHEQSVSRKLKYKRYIKRVSDAWKSGASLEDIEILLYGDNSGPGIGDHKVMSRISYFRDKYGLKMFPYRRPDHWQVKTISERAKRLTDIIKEWNTNGDIHRIQTLFGYKSYSSAMACIHRIRKLHPDKFLTQQQIFEHKLQQQTRKGKQLQ